MIKVLLVDDLPAVRQGLRLRLALEPDLIVVGEAGSGAEAIQLAQLLQPDVVVIDARMPGMDGITATQELRKLTPSVAVVVISLYDDVETRTKAHQAGAVALVEKRGPVEPLVQAIRRAKGFGPEAGGSREDHIVHPNL